MICVTPKRAQLGLRGMRKKEDAARHRVIRRHHRRVRERIVVHHQRRRWSVLLRSLEGDSTAENHGRRHESTGGKAHGGIHARSESARPVTGRQTSASCAIFTPHPEHHPNKSMHGTAPGSRIQMMRSRQLWAHERYASSREKTPPIDGFHATTQLNARDWLAKGRHVWLIDEDTVQRPGLSLSATTTVQCVHWPANRQVICIDGCGT